MSTKQVWAWLRSPYVFELNWDGATQIVQVAVRASDSAEAARLLRQAGVDRKQVGLWTKPIRLPDGGAEGLPDVEPAWRPSPAELHLAALAAVE